MGGPLIYDPNCSTLEWGKVVDPKPLVSDIALICYSHQPGFTQRPT